MLENATVGGTKKNGSIKDDMIGKKLGDYTLLRLLATGGMARIYEAEDQRLSRPAAVKVLEPSKLEVDTSLTRRFEREARSIARLEHDNIISIYQYGEQDGIYFLAMKLIRGKDFSQELSKLKKSGKKMDVERALRLLAQVAAALDFAHENYVIHRDVKPSNILIDTNDKAFLTDFGLVLQNQAVDATLGTAFGTPRYIAPEQAMASSQAVPQSDIYSLGVIVYEVVTGETPFTGDTPMQIALSHVNEAPRPPRLLNPDIPAGAEIEILRALEKLPERRQSSAKEFINNVRHSYGFPIDPTSPTAPTSPTMMEAVRQVDTQEPTTATDWDSWTSKPTKKQPARRGVLMGLFALVAVLALGAFILLSGRNANSSTGNPTQTGSAGQATDEATASVVVNPAETDFASVRLVYDDSSFALVNDGDYTLNVSALKIVRGADDGADDFSGATISRGVLQASDCARIQLQNRQTSLAPECPRNSYQALLSDPTTFFWRREPVDAASFDVVYKGQVIVQCETVTRGTGKACAFTWPVSAADAANGE
jgi:serine/threonine protein kinase